LTIPTTYVAKVKAHCTVTNALEIRMTGVKNLPSLTYHSIMAQRLRHEHGRQETQSIIFILL